MDDGAGIPQKLDNVGIIWGNKVGPRNEACVAHPALNSNVLFDRNRYSMKGADQFVRFLEYRVQTLSLS
jgi:hypothetical protein